MIEIRVRYAGLPRTEAGTAEEIWPVDEGTPLEKLLQLLEDKYGWMLKERSGYIVVYNHRGIGPDQWDQQVLKEGDLIQILSSIAGG